MLEGGLRAGAHLEVVLVGAERPHHRARLVVDLVDRPGVAQRDDQVAVGVERDRVQVVGVEHGARCTVLEERGADRDVVDRVPLEQHQPGLDVDLLDDRVHQRPLHTVPMDRGDADDVGIALRRDQELVQVHALQAVARLDGGDLLVGAVVDHALAAARAVVRISLPPGQHRLPVQLLHTEVGGELVRGERLEPDQVARGVEQHRAVLHRAVLRGQEDVAAVCARRAPVDRDRRRLEVRA